MKNFREEIDALAELLLDESLAIDPVDVPDTLYHYTDASGLVGMLTNHKVLFTDIRFLNDKTEIIHTRNLVNSLLSSYTKDNPDDLSTEFAKSVKQWQSVENADEVFSFSLSAKEDDLSQWRGYASEGKGFTIGFSGPSILKLDRLKDELGFGRVEYNAAVQMDDLRECLSRMETALRKHCGNKMKLADINAAAQKFDWLVDSRATLNKHHSFEQEAEWRLFSYIATKVNASDLKVRASGLRLVPYVEEQIMDDGSLKLPITRIGIGPAFAGGEQFHAVQALCRANGYNPDIYFADTPYRGI